MGIAELHTARPSITINSHIITYGNAATETLTAQLRNEVETLWNEAKGKVLVDGEELAVRFAISAICLPSITELEVLQNTNARNNYFRIEEFVHGRISFVDGLGCNTGYFLLENLYEGSTTAAHEYGHTLGLDHPKVLDIRGAGAPGIMYPRGTLVDAQYQYDPLVPAGEKGGTLHPMYRRVTPADIRNLKLHKLHFKNGSAVIGDFTNIYHWDHRSDGLG